MRTVVVGAGAAGLACALEAVGRGEVLVIAPDAPSRPTFLAGGRQPSSGAAATGWAQGGIAAATAPDDCPEAHAADTIAAGAGLCNPEAVSVLTGEAPDAIRWLVGLGMEFDDAGAPTLEGGHGIRRVLHAGGDATGAVLLSVLRNAVLRVPAIRPVRGRVAGLLVGPDRGGGVRMRGVRIGTGLEIEADRVVLATGGACGIFGRRSGPEPTIGTGIRMAWAAGAALADLEFVQFHPTALDLPGQPAHLFTEALRGEGARLLDADGRRFMDGLDPRAELAPRDIVARAIAAVRDASGGPVYLDATSIPGVRERFPTAAARAASAGLDIARDPIPVAPAAHYFTGGVLTDVWGRTTVPGLLACGEVACTGAHGANRLASNSLAEALVFGRRAGHAADGQGPVVASTESLDRRPPDVELAIGRLRALTDRTLGVTRHGTGLRATLETLEGAKAPNGTAVASLVAWLVARAALRREESRGGHFRLDAAESRPEWHFRQVVSLDGWSALEAEPSLARVDRAPLEA